MSKAKVLLFSDLHIHNHRKSFDRLRDCLRALDWVFETARAKDIGHVIFAGDLFQDRQKIDVLIYQMTFDILRRWCHSGELELHLLLGNHDLWFHDRWDISSVTPFSAIDGVHVIDKPGSYQIEDWEWVDFLPFTTNPISHLEDLRKAHTKTNRRRKTLVAHLACDGAILNVMHRTRADVIIEHDGEMMKVGPNMFRGWDQVFLGHYHATQEVAPNVEYIGSTLQLSFGEAFQHKHVIVYDLETGEKEYVRNTFSPQHLIIPEKEVADFDITNNFVRIVAEDIASEALVKLKADLAEQRPATLEIIPVERDEKQQLIEDAKAILYKEDEMLETWLDKQGDLHGLDKGLLLQIGKQICQTPVEH